MFSYIAIQIQNLHFVSIVIRDLRVSEGLPLKMTAKTATVL